MKRLYPLITFFGVIFISLGLILLFGFDQRYDYKISGPAYESTLSELESSWKLGVHNIHVHWVMEDKLGESANAYQEFQQEIAKLVPIEFGRPTIHVEMITSGRWRNSIALLGGMGPLSDSSILAKLAETSKQGKNLYLLSLPPPRSRADIFRYGFSYLLQLRNFFKRSWQGIYILSNTAHNYLSWLKWLSLGLQFSISPNLLLNM